ncbi:MAG: branched-chain amino acid ABC transporter permease [Oscillospiraceae bacterium]|nr:branched-chain amino acid ABC transporter permease [Oscillospiraceae bacterium]
MKQFNIPVPARYAINLGLIIAFLVLGSMLMQPGVLPRAYSNNIIQVGFFIILAVSLNLVAGYLGQLPLGHAGFMAVGAYTGAIFWNSGLLPGTASIVAGLFLAGVIAAIFGIIIGIPALRLRGDYLAIITLGFGEMIRVLVTNLPSITGGAPGLSSPRHSSFLVVYICVILTCVGIHMLMKSRHGRAILSIRENEIAAESCGINTTYYKVMAFAVSAFFAGVAGALFAGNTGFLVPDSFDFMMSINILMIVVLGGMGSMIGSIVAAAILTSFPVFMQGVPTQVERLLPWIEGLPAWLHWLTPVAERLSIWAVWAAANRLIVYAVLLIIVMIFKPRGLCGNYDFSLSRLLEKFTRLFTKAPVEKGGEDLG